MQSNELREKLKLFNMHELAKLSGVGYSTLKNFSSGYRENLTVEAHNKVVRAIKSIQVNER